jgi:hypothetical protein
MLEKVTPLIVVPSGIVAVTIASGLPTPESLVYPSDISDVPERM